MSTSNSDEKPVIRCYGVSGAKNNFARILEEAQAGAVLVTNHGRLVAVIIGIEGIPVEEGVAARTINEMMALIEKYRTTKRSTEEP